jgi:RNA-directed DNA polymerase
MGWGRRLAKGGQREQETGRERMKPRESSLSEKPIRRHSRRLVDWLNLAGAKKVHSLVDKIYKMKNLELAWEKVRQNKGAGGIDGESIEAFEREAVEKLERLHEGLKDDTYRPQPSAHHALCTLNEIIAGKKVSWVLEADLKNFFGSLDHGWLLRFVEHRVGDPRIISLIKRWLKAGVLEEGEFHSVETGTPQGGSISVLLSNIYLHYVLDLWFEKVIKPKLKGEAYLVRYIDDFVVCFQLRSDAIQFQDALVKRLGKFSLELEPKKTRLVEFGRFALRMAKERGKRLETIYFLGFTHFCTRNRKGNFMVGHKIEKTRFRRSVQHIQTLMRGIRHYSLREQVEKINQVLRGHYAYYGVGGNFKSLFKIQRFAERYWHKMLSSRSRKSYITWERFQSLKQVFPLQRPKLSVPYMRMKVLAVL